VLSGYDWWIVFDSEVPCFWLLNERGTSLALFDSCGMIQTKRPIKSHHSSLFAFESFLVMIKPQSLELHSAKMVSGDEAPLILQRCRRLCLKALSMRAFALFVQPPIHQPVLAKGGSVHFLTERTDLCQRFRRYRRFRGKAGRLTYVGKPSRLALVALR
jgi:hypothetical protein